MLENHVIKLWNKTKQKNHTSKLLSCIKKVYSFVLWYIQSNPDVMQLTEHRLGTPEKYLRDGEMAQ